MTQQTTDYSKPKNSKKILISEEQDGMIIWLGNNEHVQKTAGQVFYNGANGSLESVAILPQATLSDSTLMMQIFPFDASNKTWGEKICEAQLEVHASDCEEWLLFSLNHQPLQSGQWYGFKLICNQGQIAIAEGHKAGSKELQSMQWTASAVNDKGVFHSDFHLAYVVELAA